jgi:hypothetical protein
MNFLPQARAERVIIRYIHVQGIDWWKYLFLQTDTKELINFLYGQHRNVKICTKQKRDKIRRKKEMAKIRRFIHV